MLESPEIERGYPDVSSLVLGASAIGLVGGGSVLTEVEMVHRGKREAQQRPGNWISVKGAKDDGALRLFRTVTAWIPADRTAAAITNANARTRNSARPCSLT